MPGFVDLHCHVLPGLDDGPPQLPDAVKLVQTLVDLGFEEFHPTPHQTAHAWAPEQRQRLAAAAALRGALKRTGCSAYIAPPAGENMWDELFLRRTDDLTFPTYDGGKAFLLEFAPPLTPPQLPERLFEFRVKGLLPVIAHIERYPDILHNAEKLAGKAALLVNLGTLGGGFGAWGARARARKLVAEGVVHAVATDAHGVDDARDATAGLKWLRRHVGDDAMQQLLVHGPRQILGGEAPDPR